MLNQVLEATLAVMILLLALSLSVIARIRPTAGSPTEARDDSESAGLAASTDVPAPALWPGPLTGGVTAPAPPASKPGRFIQRRYEARHVRGQVPRQRVPGPAGPPWEPAVPPPARPQQGSERLT
jgi:hypothetical protein